MNSLTETILQLRCAFTVSNKREVWMGVLEQFLNGSVGSKSELQHSLPDLASGRNADGNGGHVPHYTYSIDIEHERFLIEQCCFFIAIALL
jgi:hypothetical protein